jgi:hypothetical protein
MLFDVADKRFTLRCTGSHQAKAILLSPVRDSRHFSEDKLVEIRKTERLRSGLRKVQSFSGATGFWVPGGRRRKFASFDRGRRLICARTLYGRPIRGHFVVVANFVGAVNFESFLNAHWNEKEIRVH